MPSLSLVEEMTKTGTHKVQVQHLKTKHRLGYKLTFTRSNLEEIQPIKMWPLPNWKNVK